MIIIYTILLFYKQDYLRDLWKKIADPRNGLELQSHRYRLKMYQNCLVGNELTDWLLRQQKANSRCFEFIFAQLSFNLYEYPIPYCILIIRKRIVCRSFLFFSYSLLFRIYLLLTSYLTNVFYAQYFWIYIPKLIYTFV